MNTTTAPPELDAEYDRLAALIDHPEHRRIIRAAARDPHRSPVIRQCLAWSRTEPDPARYAADRSRFCQTAPPAPSYYAAAAWHAAALILAAEATR